MMINSKNSALFRPPIPFPINNLRKQYGKYINPYTDLVNLTSEQRSTYEKNLIRYWGMKSALETAAETAIETNKLQNVRKVILKGYDNETIADLIGLSIEQKNYAKN
ncbi:MAG TPA: hypothetical protein PKH93_13565 [Chitinophagales bacterium]|nr:hypothetical protein [Chitinophagales bacterium]